ncbi:MAG: NUDIX hydrolase [Acidobacteriota bacterium]
MKGKKKKTGAGRRHRAPKVRREHSAGGLVVRAGEILLISLQDGKRWQLPKGHIEKGETLEQTALREVQEETGVTGQVVAPLPYIEYRFPHRRKEIHKRVDYFLLEYIEGSTDDYDPEEVSGAAWFPWDEGIALLSFDNEREVAIAGRDRWRQRSEEALASAAAPDASPRNP